MAEPQDLDDRLARSVPTTSERTAERDSAVRGLIAATGPRRLPRRRHTVGVVAGAVALISMGGVAAASGNWDSWWASDAVHEYDVAVPSGVSCTGVIGNVEGPDSAAVVAAEEFLSHPDLLEVVDVEAAEPFQQSALDDPVYDADFQAWSAMDAAVFVSMLDHVRSLGLSIEDLSYEAEFNCRGFEGVSGG